MKLIKRTQRELFSGTCVAHSYQMDCTLHLISVITLSRTTI